MTAYFFGARWDAPMVDDADQVPTPVGAACLVCHERIQDGDRGTMRGVVRMTDGTPSGSIEPAHAECEMLTTIGHVFGVCRCTGYDTFSRTAALALLERLNAKRAEQGMGPL